MGRGLRSMTGYGSSQTNVDGWRLDVTCRSVNHKSLSVRVQPPEELCWVEPEVVRRIRERVARGRVEVKIGLEPGADGTRIDFEAIDEKRFSVVARELKRLAVDHGLYSPVSMEAMWEYRPFFERSAGKVLSEERGDDILPVVDEAIDEMVQSRVTEGEGIARELSQLLEALAQHLDEVDQLIDEQDSERRSRVESRLRKALEEFEVGEIDERRLTQEVAYYVEKGDISEEFQRSRSHIERLKSIVDQSREAVGKKIDFYLQELIRETNTMGSKSQYAKLTDRIIDMKSLVEKMREQAANVE